MASLIIIFGTISFVLLTGLIGIFAYIKHRLDGTITQANLRSGDKITSMNWIVILLLFVALVFILFSFLAPVLFTQFSTAGGINFSNTGQIGDTIGGLMNPFVALSGVIVTGLAFYIQYRANKLQRHLFEVQQTDSKNQFQDQLDNQRALSSLQQFEAHFYEMLRLHRENILEMKIEGYVFEGKAKSKVSKDTLGRKIFVTMKAEFEAVLSLYTQDRPLDLKAFIKCYKLYFHGIKRFQADFPEEKDFVMLVKKVRKQHEDNPDLFDDEERKEYSGVKLNFNYRPFSGHVSRLGHYYRHLYHCVKFVATSEVVTNYEDRMKFLDLLRAQLSNHEQVLLFYNWVATFGENWEIPEQRFLTEYKMIHNLMYPELFKHNFINEKVDELRKKPVLLRKGNMFELD